MVGLGILTSLVDGVSFGSMRIRHFYRVNGRTCFTTEFHGSVFYHWMYIMPVSYTHLVLRTYQVQDTILSVELLIQQESLTENRLVPNTALRDQKTLNKLSAHQ